MSFMFYDAETTGTNTAPGWPVFDECIKTPEHFLGGVDFLLESSDSLAGGFRLLPTPGGQGRQDDGQGGQTAIGARLDGRLGARPSLGRRSPSARSQR